MFIEIVKLVIHQLRISPRRSLMILFLSLLTGVLEGVSIAMLIPLLELLMQTNEVGMENKYEFLMYFFEPLGLELVSVDILLVFCAFITIKSLFGLAAMNYIGKVIAEINYELTSEFLDAVLHAKWPTIVNRKSGEILNAISIEVQKVSSVYRYCCTVIASLFHVIALFVVLYIFSIYLAIGAIILGLVLIISLGYFVSLASQQSFIQVTVMNSFMARVHDILAGIKVIKAMNLSHLVMPIVLSEAEQIKKATRRQIIAKHGLNYLREPVVIVFLSIGLFLSIEVIETKPEILLASVALFVRMATSIGKLQNDYQLLVANVHYKNAFQRKSSLFLNNKEQIGNNQSFDFKQNIKYENVTFSHGENVILNSGNFTFPVSGFISIIGESGLGKTTLVDMLLGLYEPDSGSIMIGPMVINETGGQAFRNSIGYVQQESFIFNESAFLNVGLGNPKISRKMVVDALKKSHVYEFLASLPEGIDTNLGESGSTLSGGQKQRIAIARALVRKPKILILDEATSALDLKTMVSILDDIKEISKSILVIAISHQKEVIDLSDQVYRLKNKDLELVK